MKKLDDAVAEIIDDLVALRHHLHMHPEVAHQEHETSALLEERLKSLPGARVTRFPDTTGFVVDFDSSGGGDDAPSLGVSLRVLLRADMDALPIAEGNAGLPYRSQAPGRAHLCGHDGHMAAIVGAATLLSRGGGPPRGCAVRLLLQPAEESADGAQRMLRDDCASAVVGGVDEAYGMHCWPIGRGRVAVRCGPAMAQSTRFEVRVFGKGGHGSAPHTAVDPLVCAAHVVVALQTVVARNVSPFEAAVVTVGVLRAGDVENAIASSAFLGGTIRTFTPETFAVVERRFREVVAGTCAALGCSCDVHIQVIAPALVNAPEQAAAVARAARRALPDAPQDAVGEAGQPVSASEDFAYFAERVPSAFWFNGIACTVPNHHPDFDHGDESLATAVKVWVRLLEDRFKCQLYA